MGRAEAAVLSLYLASHTCPTSATITAAAATGQTVDADLRGVNAVRILLNTSKTICFVNSVVQCLAWTTLLADGFHRDQWRFGFELMRNVTLYSFVPLDLLRHQPFLWLMIGVGVLTEASLQRQQDVREFCAALLNLLQPSFVQCGWESSQPSWLTGVRLCSLNKRALNSHLSNCHFLTTVMTLVSFKP